MGCKANTLRNAQSTLFLANKNSEQLNFWIELVNCVGLDLIAGDKKAKYILERLLLCAPSAAQYSKQYYYLMGILHATQFNIAKNEGLIC